ncbi:MAG: SLC13 family permease [Melioribacteraceae bacterium]|jgi:di/tricarboxylate transporter|nr:SLC13 family permease [Melioribacteraceae bacterium]RJP62982.1 MAG: SLC13 family permease [Ignavibacteriales bacterium]WKZ69349.1 MAG: SLC13 family permease [Melioribacteraceae bacterium]
MDYIFVFIILVMILVLFVWDRIRYDLVSLFGLLTLVILGIIPADKAFLGFGHPAVITVAVILIIGKALENSGLIDVLGKWITKVGSNISIQIVTLSLLIAFSSAFMNNVGALAILMPVTIQIAKKNNYPPSYLLMPLAFASLLGGMLTLIGTPPNIIIANFRAEEIGEAYGMFDFTFVGAGILLIGILFISTIGWRLLPKYTAKKSQEESFVIDDYITEVKVGKNSKVIGLNIEELGKLSKADIQILGLIRNNKRIHAPSNDEVLLGDDVIILESDTEELKVFIDDTELKLIGDKSFRKDATGSKDITITEAVVMADSPLIGNTTSNLRMRSRYGVNLLAVSRKEKKIHNRLDHVIFRKGDVLMLQGRAQTIDESIKSMGCLPLARRNLRIGFEKRIAVTLSVFIIAIMLVVFNLLQVHIAFSIAAIVIVLAGVLPLKEIYSGIDWPVIVLLGAMIPIGEAVQTTGGTDQITAQILSFAKDLPIWTTLGLVLVVTMLLSAVINNAATVVLMSPIGIGIANSLNLSIDPFLMAIAVGASASFLTPIGHQSNTLIMGPGGYRFGDYFRMGLPLSILIVIIAIPLILFFWPV